MQLTWEERPDYVLREEIEELKLVERTQYKPIILKMADKLASLDYIQNDKISSYLAKVLKNHCTDRYIQRVLPDKYKHKEMNRFAEQVRQLNGLEEFVDAYKHVFVLGLKFLDDINRKARKDQELLEVLLRDTPFNELTGSAREIIIDFGHIAELTDYREKLTMFNKVILKMDMFHFSLHKIANNVHQTAKWMKAIDRDPKLKSYLEKLDRCPRCDWKMAEWFNKNVIRLEKGLPIKFPDKVDFDK